MRDPQLQALLDRARISDTVHQYATGIDRRDWSLYRDCFTDEVEVDFQSWNGAPPARMKADDWVAAVRDGLSGFDATQHLTANHVHTLAGNHATCVASMQAEHVLVSGAGDSRFTLGGYYTHQLVRTPEGWKIHGCRLTVTWQRGNRHLFEIAAQRARGAATS